MDEIENEVGIVVLVTANRLGIPDDVLPGMLRKIADRLDTNQKLKEAV